MKFFTPLPRKINFFLYLFILLSALRADNELVIKYKMNLNFFPQKINHPAVVKGVNHITITNHWIKPLAEVYLHNNSNGYYDPKDAKSSQTTIGRVQSTRLGKVKETEKISMKIGLFPELKPGESVIISVPFTTRFSQDPSPFIPTVGTRADTTIYNLVFFYPVLEFFHEDGWHVKDHQGKTDPHSNLAEYQITLTFPVGYQVGTSAHLIRSDTLRTGLVEQELYYPRAISFSTVASEQLQVRRTHINDITVDLLFTPGQEDNANDLLENLRELVPFYEEQFGPCPNDKLTIAMSYALGAGAIATANYISFQGALEGAHTLGHELAHQWFGNSINADESYETWLNESFAEYAYWLYQESKTEIETTNLETELDLFDFWSDLRSLEIDDLIRLVHDVIGDRALPAIYQPSKQTNWESQAHIYTRYFAGNHALQMLQSSIGDNAMKEIMHTYTRQNVWKSVDTETFIAVVVQVAGQSIADNFRLALTTGIRPDLKIVKVNTKTGKDRRWNTTVETDYEGEWLLPVDVQVVTAAGDTVDQKQVKLSQIKQINFITSSPVISVELDPRRRMFDSNRYNNRWPRRFTFQPIYGLPSWEVYKLYYRPRIKKDWQGDWRYGVRVSGGLGLNLMPILPAFYQNSFDLDVTFSTSRADYNWGGKVAYRTPFKSIDLMYWEFSASYEYPRNRQALSLINYLDEPSYFVVNGQSAYQQLTTQIMRTEYVHADSGDWWNKGRTITLNEEFIKFFYSRWKRSVLRASLLVGQALESDQLGIYYRFSSALDYEQHALDWFIVRFHSEGGFVWDDRPNDDLRYQLKYTPRIWKERENFIPLFRGFSDIDQEWWNTVLGLGISLGLETNSIVWPMIYLDGAVVQEEAGSLVDRISALSQFDPVYLAFGIGLESQSLVEVGVYFPFWVSDPPIEESNWKLRLIMQWGFYF